MVYDRFNEFGLKNCKIELLEKFPCYRKDELEAGEGHYQREHECVNRMMAGGRIKIDISINKPDAKSNSDMIHANEWRQKYYKQNKGELQDKCKQYYILNRKKILEQKKNIEKINISI